MTVHVNMHAVYVNYCKNTRYFVYAGCVWRLGRPALRVQTYYYYTIVVQFPGSYYISIQFKSVTEQPTELRGYLLVCHKGKKFQVEENKINAKFQYRKKIILNTFHSYLYTDFNPVESGDNAGF